MSQRGGDPEGEPEAQAVGGSPSPQDDGPGSQTFIPPGLILTAEPEPYGSPSLVEMIVPPVAMVVVILCGLIIFAWAAWKASWIKNHSCSCPRGKEEEENDFCDIGAAEREVTSLLTEEDWAIIAKFESFQHSPVKLAKIVAPAILTISTAPFLFYFYRFIMTIFWPTKFFPVPPKINDVVASYLTPAGLIYAVSFGFAYEDCLNRHASLRKQLAKLMNDLMQVTNLCLNLHCLTRMGKIEILKEEKNALILWMSRISSNKNWDLTYEKRDMGFWKIITMLTHAYDYSPSGIAKSDEIMLKAILQLIREADRTIRDPLDHFRTHIPLLQWIFMEALGFFSFFGVYLLNAQSYKVELTMSTITLFSVSIFSYVLADLDHPLHGAFRINLTGVSKFVNYLHVLHQAKVDPTRRGSVELDMKDIFEQRSVLNHMRRKSSTSSSSTFTTSTRRNTTAT